MDRGMMEGEGGGRGGRGVWRRARNATTAESEFCQHFLLVFDSCLVWVYYTSGKIIYFLK